MAGEARAAPPVLDLDLQQQRPPRPAALGAGGPPGQGGGSAVGRPDQAQREVVQLARSGVRGDVRGRPARERAAVALHVGLRPDHEERHAVQRGMGEQAHLRRFAVGARAAVGQDEQARRRQLPACQRVALTEHGDLQAGLAQQLGDPFPLRPARTYEQRRRRGQGPGYRPGPPAAAVRAALGFSPPTGGPPGPRVRR